MTAGPTLIELSVRARDIFRLVVEGYINTGLPVGSKTLAGNGGVNLSPASIRSVLQELQDAGLLSAAHTSAGRMPTEIGLRLFVDGIMQVAEPSLAERNQIERGLAHGGTIRSALAAASAALSELSAGAGVVMVPRREPLLLQISFVTLTTHRALVVLVAEDGGIENRVVELPEPVMPGVLEAAGNYLTARLTGRTLAEAAQGIAHEIASGKSALDTASADLVRRGLAIWVAIRRNARSWLCAGRPICWTMRRSRIWSGCGNCSMNWKASNRLRKCSMPRAWRRRRAFSSAVKTA